MRKVVEGLKGIVLMCIERQMIGWLYRIGVCWIVV